MHGSHSHSHSHGANAHSHASNETRMAIAALLTGLFMFVEVGGGLVSGSLALLADAGHMLTDFASLSLAWFGFRLARRPADWKRTYGFDRFQVMVAFINGLALVVISLWIVYEAYERLSARAPVEGGIMAVIASIGLLANIVCFLLLHGADRENLNVRGAAIHVMGDLLGSIAALVAGVVIVFTNWTPIDPLLSLLVSLIILRSAWRVISESGHILLEGAPQGIDTREIGPDLIANVPCVCDVHHVHVWAITQERTMVTLHAEIGPSDDVDAAVLAIKKRLQDRFGLSHATVEIEHGICADAPLAHQH
jgi:cobalt-zinc-cadmium efflux system protein